jgi:hypothetical protein
MQCLENDEPYYGYLDLLSTCMSFSPHDTHTHHTCRTHARKYAPYYFNEAQTRRYTQTEKICRGIIYKNVVKKAV